MFSMQDAADQLEVSVSLCSPYRWAV